MQIATGLNGAIVKILPFLLTFVGAFALYICSRNRGIRPFSALHAFNIKIDRNTRPRVIIFDAVFTSVLGAIIGYFATQPTTNAQAVAARFAFVGIINTFGDKHERSPSR
jgi:hypothetical protein